MGIKLTTQQKLNKALIQRMLENQKNACYVLITCGSPTNEGKMDVELTYDGDLDLAAYLIDVAQTILDEKLSMDE